METLALHYMGLGSNVGEESCFGEEASQLKTINSGKLLGPAQTVNVMIRLAER